MLDTSWAPPPPDDTGEPLLGLAGARLWHPAQGVELTFAKAGQPRTFTPRLTEGLELTVNTGAAAPTRIEGRLEPVPVATLVIVPPRTVWSSERVRCGFSSLEISAERLRAFVESRSPRPRLPARVSYAPGSGPRDAFLRAHRRIRTAASPLAADEELERLLAWILAADARSSSAPLRVPGARLERVREILHVRCAEEVSLADLSATSGIERSALVRAFRDRFGIPPHAYQLRVRLARAKWALAAGAAVGQVALELGFWDQSHFTRHFRRAAGLAPSEYARAARRAPGRG
jgi:AraC-like DNA-binding protein